ncbi:hypothetical protein M0802_007535 [Mischocyttarus mexicanus]|nr:hypothetical protein M0802_007535 [Mischocyttarus mexicanus]
MGTQEEVTSPEEETEAKKHPSIPNWSLSEQHQRRSSWAGWLVGWLVGGKRSAWREKDAEPKWSARETRKKEGRGRGWGWVGVGVIAGMSTADSSRAPSRQAGRQATRQAGRHTHPVHVSSLAHTLLLEVLAQPF